MDRRRSGCHKYVGRSGGEKWVPQQGVDDIYGCYGCAGIMMIYCSGEVLGIYVKVGTITMDASSYT